MKILWMNMQSCILITAYVLMCLNMLCNAVHTIESARHPYMGNSSKNICPKSESDILYPHMMGKLSNLHKGFANDIVKLLKHKFSSMVGNRIRCEGRRDETQDDPNLMQSLMSRAFIDSANHAFHNIEKEDPESFVLEKHDFQMVKNPKLKTEVHLSSRSKRYASTDRTSEADVSDDSEDAANEKQDACKDSDDSEMRIHCIKKGPSELICKHENYTFHFKLPAELFDKKVMENLVSSVCSIIDEAFPNGGGKIDVSVKKSTNNLKKDIDNNRSKSLISNKSESRDHKEGPEKAENKVIRINIPIDFSAIPLDIEDYTYQNCRSDNDVFLDSRRTYGGENSSLHHRGSNKKKKKMRYQQNKPEDSYSFNSDLDSDLNIDTLAIRQDCCTQNNERKVENQEKILNKRNNLQNSMVFPPSLILFKRSSKPQTTQHSNYEEKSYKFPPN